MIRESGGACTRRCQRNGGGLQAADRRHRAGPLRGYCVSAGFDVNDWANAPVRLRCSLLRDQGVGTAATALARTCRGGIVEHRLPGLPEHHYLPHPGHTTSCGRRGRRRPAVVGLRHGYAGGQRGAPLRPGVPSSARARAHRGARARHRKPTGGRGRRFSSERPCRVRDTAERLCWACVARRPRTDSSLGR